MMGLDRWGITAWWRFTRA